MTNKLQEEVYSAFMLPKEAFETKNNSANTIRLQNEQFKDKLAKKYGIEVK